MTQIAHCPAEDEGNNPPIASESFPRAEWGAVMSKTVTPLERAATRWVRERRARREISQCTATNYLVALRGFALIVGPRPVTAVTQRDVERYVASQNHLGASTINVRLAAVRSFCEHLVRDGKLNSNPARNVRGPRRPRPCPRSLTDEQMGLLFAACQDSRDRMVISLAVQLGLRCGEIADLETGDVDLIGKTVIVQHGKGGKRAVLPLTGEAEAAIRAYIDAVGLSAGPLVRSLQNPQVPLSRQWVSQIFRRVAYEAGVKVRGRDGVDLHSMRHTFATGVYRQTRDAYVLRDALRHSTLATSEVYTRGPSFDELRHALEGRCYRNGV